MFMQDSKSIKREELYISSWGFKERGGGIIIGPGRAASVLGVKSRFLAKEGLSTYKHTCR